MKIQESAENYLKAILVINKQKGAVHGVDIARLLGFSKPSVSIAMKNLKENGYVVVDQDNNIKLTDKGFAIAETVYNRHQLITNVLVKMGVSESVAAVDACRIEHIVCPETIECMEKYLNAK